MFHLRVDTCTILCGISVCIKSVILLMIATSALLNVLRSYDTTTNALSSAFTHEFQTSTSNVLSGESDDAKASCTTKIT
jgi:hypothetical protein